MQAADQRRAELWPRLVPQVAFVVQAMVDEFHSPITSELALASVKVAGVGHVQREQRAHGLAAGSWQLPWTGPPAWPPGPRPPTSHVCQAPQ